MPRLATLAVLVTSGSVAAAPCAIVENVPMVLTPPDAALADGGGVIVATLPNYQSVAKHGALESWRFADRSTPAVKHVAPGLDVLATAGPATLEDADHKVLVRVKHATTAPAALDAPPIGSVSRTSPANARHPFTQITATLRANPPSGAVALIVYDKAGTTARSWGQVTTGNQAIVVFASGGCTIQVAADSPLGDSVRIAWLDASGRVSKLSPPIEVVAGTL